MTRQVRTSIFILAFGFLLANGVLNAQPVDAPDAPETLEWVIRRANRLDQLLNGAAIAMEVKQINLQLYNAHQEFDAVAQMGLACTDARIAAERGRAEADILGYQRSSDMNALVIRAVEARRQAKIMAASADICMCENEGRQAVDIFGPRAVLRKDAEIATLDIEDAIEIDDPDIKYQKIEHALYLLRSAEYLASTLNDCADVRDYANEAIRDLAIALSKDKERSIDHYLKRALKSIDDINNCQRCR